MIEPGRSGHRNRAVARHAARQVSTKKNGFRLTWILDRNSGVQQGRRRRVRDRPSAADIAVAGHHRTRFGEPVQTGLAKCGQRRDGGQPCRATHVAPKPKRRLIPPASLSRGTDTGSAVGWINLTTCVSSGVSPCLLVLPTTLR